MFQTCNLRHFSQKETYLQWCKINWEGWLCLGVWVLEFSITASGKTVEVVSGSEGLDPAEFYSIPQWPIFFPLHLWSQLPELRICLPMQETQEMRVWSLGWEDPLEEEMATHSSILAWEIPWTEEPGGLQSMGLQRVWHDWATNHTRTEIIS